MIVARILLALFAVSDAFLCHRYSFSSRLLATWPTSDDPWFRLPNSPQKPPQHLPANLRSTQNYIFDFGKFRGISVQDVPKSYLEWIVREKVYAGRPELEKSLLFMRLIKPGARVVGPTLQRNTNPPVRFKVNVELISTEKFMLSCFPPSPVIFDHLKADPSLSRCHNPISGCWTFPLEHYDQVLEIIEKCGVHRGPSGRASDKLQQHTFEAVPKSLVKGLEAMLQPKKRDHSSDRTHASTETSSSGVATSDEVVEELLTKTHLGASLMPFQREGVKFAVKHGGRALIGDEMGLGKTLQALAVAMAYRDEWPLLVIAPSSLLLNWAHEIRTWLPDERDIKVVASGTDNVDGRITVISYDLVSRLEAQLRKAQFAVVIADESHYLKSASAQRTQAVVPLLQAARRVVLLTGTPALSRPVELFSQVHALRPGLFPKRADFVKRYCDAKQAPWGVDVSGASNLAELHTVLRELVMIRRLKSEVLTQLPDKRRQQVLLSLPERRLRSLRRMLDQLLQRANTDGSTRSAEGDRSLELFRLYRETGVAKAEVAVDYVVDLIEGGTKFLVFAHHTEVLNQLEAAVRANGAMYVRIDGSVPAAQRQERVEKFQSDPTVRVGLLSLTAAGVGLTLTAATAVVFAELHWTPGVMNQAEDRVHRIGQRCAINVIYLHAPGTLDDLIWPLVIRKTRVVGRLLEGDGPVSPASWPDTLGNGALMHGMDEARSYSGSGLWSELFASVPPQQTAVEFSDGSTWNANNLDVESGQGGDTPSTTSVGGGKDWTIERDWNSEIEKDLTWDGPYEPHDAWAPGETYSSTTSFGDDYLGWDAPKQPVIGSKSDENSTSDRLAGADELATDHGSICGEAKSISDGEYGPAVNVNPSLHSLNSDDLASGPDKMVFCSLDGDINISNAVEEIHDGSPDCFNPRAVNDDVACVNNSCEDLSKMNFSSQIAADDVVRSGDEISLDNSPFPSRMRGKGNGRRKSRATSNSSAEFELNFSAPPELRHVTSRNRTKVRLSDRGIKDGLHCSNGSQAIQTVEAAKSVTAGDATEAVIVLVDTETLISQGSVGLVEIGYEPVTSVNISLDLAALPVDKKITGRHGTSPAADSNETNSPSNVAEQVIIDCTGSKEVPDDACVQTTSYSNVGVFPSLANDSKVVVAEGRVTPVDVASDLVVVARSAAGVRKKVIELEGITIKRRRGRPPRVQEDAERVLLQGNRIELRTKKQLVPGSGSRLLLDDRISVHKRPPKVRGMKSKVEDSDETDTNNTKEVENAQIWQGAEEP